MKNISEIPFFGLQIHFYFVLKKVKWSLILNKAKRKNIIPTKGALEYELKNLYTLLLM